MRQAHSLRQTRRPARKQQANNTILELDRVSDPAPVELLIRDGHDSARGRLAEFEIPGPAVHEDVPRGQADFRGGREGRLLHVRGAHDDLGVGLAQLVGEFVGRGGGARGREDPAGGDGRVEHHGDHEVACGHVEDDVFVGPVGADAVLVSEYVGDFLG